jgi:hypothetical protein
MMLGQEPRQTTSNLGHLAKPSIQALIHGLNRHYYSIAISYRKNELEERMLMNLQKKAWTHGLTLRCARALRPVSLCNCSISFTARLAPALVQSLQV